MENPLIANHNYLQQTATNPAMNSKHTTHTQAENNWHYLPLIKAITALAALFHDWGKASDFFQTKLFSKQPIADPVRHEWVSLLIISELCRDKTDKDWLQLLIEGKVDFASLAHTNLAQQKAPFKQLPNLALVLGWLVVTHHRMPEVDTPSNRIFDLANQLKRIRASWGYENPKRQQDLPLCFQFSKGLVSDSDAWLKAVKKWSQKLLDALPLFEKAMQTQVWRPIILHCRLSLMLGDHNYSSQPAQHTQKAHKKLTLYANTDSNKRPKQTLEEHILGVTQQAVKIAHHLPIFEGEPFLGKILFGSAISPPNLTKQQPTNAKFQWQYNAAQKIHQWRQTQKKLDSKHFGCFIVNMASTGQGKTFANAKIMRALSENGEGLRYILALGLRTLTLQTGDEYRQRIGLDQKDLAVLIGSKAIKRLHEQPIQSSDKHHHLQDENLYQGSESQEGLLDASLDFEGNPQIEELLTTVLTNSKHKQFLYAPVLACTIDHIMGATETTRGGKYILPTLRLMSSDLVIDEVDDFDGNDLIALGRLIHLAGMLGRKVMLSSATLPPDMVEGFYNAYQSGWARFAQMRSLTPKVAAIWVDEFKTQIASFPAQIPPTNIPDYQLEHQKFIKHRLTQLQKQLVKQKAQLIPLELKQPPEKAQQTFEHTIMQAIIQQHQAHAYLDKHTNKKVSVGVVRVANITPCIELTRFLLKADWGDEIDIRAMAYHSWQLLIMRNAQEKFLDKVMKRKAGRQSFLQHPEIHQHLKTSKEKHPQGKHLIFILVATPVEEVGRDHDFDWAVVEPSSLRAIIQLAGRVWRHQTLKQPISSPNIALLQTNLRALKGEEIAFTQPGYESKALKLASKDIAKILDIKKLSQSIDASLRIQRTATLQPQQKLDDLEHEAIHRLLTDYQNLEPGRMQEWLCGLWWMTNLSQKKYRFRTNPHQESPNLYRLPLKEEDPNKGWVFCEKGPNQDPIPVERWYNIQQIDDLSPLQKQRLWLKRNYAKLLKNTDEPTLKNAALIYGELNFVRYKETDQFLYCDQLGLQKHS